RNLALVDAGDVQKVFDQTRKVVSLNLHAGVNHRLALFVRLALQQLKSGVNGH
uniref:Aspartate carbamoyltransferase n=1 Tax=Parastrongyloides trichosuri TaxID=131310 RepID=A0A0N4ZGV0_PARTI